MSEQRSPFAPGIGDVLDFHVAQFLATLAKAGYSEKTLRDKWGAIVPFSRWVRESGIEVVNLDESCVAAFLARLFRGTDRWRRARATLPQFLQYLRSLGIVPPHLKELSPAEVLVRRYLDHLRDAQGLCPRSIEVYSPFVRTFVVAQRLPETASVLHALAVRAYVLDRSQGRSVSFVRLLTAALRSFLRFCFFDRVTVADLSRAVPPVRRWRLTAVPPFLTAEEVEQVISAAARCTARDLRSFAMLLLLARLGLRAGEIVALELDDIRWDVGEIVVRGKGRLHDQLPLLHDVGEALARYLREARGPSESRRVFLRRIAPHVELSGPSAVCNVAREALRRLGLRPAGRVGAHIFRHSLATKMVRGGASLEEISQVLRHRSVTSTRLYAKVELEALHGVALPWPSAKAQP